ncbi:MAG: GTPase (G3E family) [Firmicutes bacterium]|nr:GTPase (G3E family) [Bacillota bacterium]NBI62947.1 GTPase (G3E family) [Clostridiales bacterium]
MATKYMVVSGFLGSGKTTAMIAFARNLNARGLGSAAILANDLGAGNIVDAEFTAAAGITSLPISGGCICYQHENLVGKLHQLEAAGADVIFSDVPGCGIGAMDHVYLELKDKEKDEFDLMPFTCLVDPERLRMVMPEQADIHLPEEMKFLLDAQMAEADIIILNKIDTISEAEAHAITNFIKSIYPSKPVMTMSAMMGTGVTQVVDYILGHRSQAIHREIGYGSDTFIAAEEKMSWFNTRVWLRQREDKNLDFNEVIADIFEGVRAGLKKHDSNVPHLKMFAADSDEELTDFFKASLIGIDYDVIYDRKLDRKYSALSLIINARCAADPVVMADIVDDAVDVVSVKYDMKVRTFFLETFGMMEEGKFNLGKASRYD